MNITENLARISNAKNGIKEAIRGKGIGVSDSALLDEYPALIDSIGLVNEYKDLYDLRTSNGTNMAYLFSCCTAPELDLRKFDMSKATDMNNMFYKCSSSVNIDGWNTSNVTNMQYMFSGFTGSIDATKLNTSNVTNVVYMFQNANTDNIILAGLSFPKCTSLTNMFNGATGTILDLSSWNISNIKNMNYIFAGGFKKIDLTGWRTNNVTDMGSMFNQYNNPLEELIIPDWDMTNVTSSGSFMNSSYMVNLKLIDLSRSNDVTITKIASYLPTRTITAYGTVLVPYDISQAAYNALITKYWRVIGAAGVPTITSTVLVLTDELVIDNETTITCSNNEPWYGDDTNNVIEYVLSNDTVVTMDSSNKITPLALGTTEITAINKETKEAVSTPISLTVFPAGYFDVRFKTTDNKGNISIYLNSTSSTKVTVFDSETNEWVYENKNPITRFRFYNNSSYVTEFTNLSLSKHITSMYSMFSGCENLTSLDVSNFDTSNVTTMYCAFKNCKKLTSLDVSNWDTNKVTTMYEMFNGCNSLTSLDTSNWDTGKVTTMCNMFQNCTNLQQLDVSNWDTSSVTDMEGLFQRCENLASLDTSNWVTGNVTTMKYMFSGCSKLISLDASSWDTSKVTNMLYMFSGCSDFTSLDASNWEISSEANLKSIFINCNKLRTLRLDNCSNATISKIITSEGFPTGTISGITKMIYCKRANAAGLTAPTNWVFNYVD